MSLTRHPKIEWDIKKIESGQYIQYFFWDNKTEQEELQEKLDFETGYGPYPQPKIVRYLTSWIKLHDEASGEFIKIEAKIHYKNYVERTR